MNVVLIGLSGSGKSSVGRELAQRLGWWFVDTDTEIVRTAGKPIHRIFAEDGEAEFRRLEEDEVRRALSGNFRVVSLGGGAVTRAANVEMLASHVVVLLEAAVETMVTRLLTADTEPRPLVGTGWPPTPVRRGGGSSPAAPSPDTVRPAIERLERLKAERAAIYHSLASVTISTEGVDVAGATSRVLQAIEGMLKTSGQEV